MEILIIGILIGAAVQGLFLTLCAKKGWIK